MPSIQDMLSRYRCIAVVGLSSNPDRPSHGVAHYLQAHGYRIIPVNPAYAGKDILGERCYATLAEASAALTEKEQIEIVDCFRKSEAIEPIVRDAMAIGAKCIWMQLGVVNEQAAAMAREAGLEVIMDKCIKIEHQALRP
ncbi:MAG: CoA-binding protein [Burkholderiaceae bacterium]